MIKQTIAMNTGYSKNREINWGKGLMEIGLKRFSVIQNMLGSFGDL